MTRGTGMVLPPGAVAPVASLPDGKLDIEVKVWAPENEGKVDAEGKPAMSYRDSVIIVFPDGHRTFCQIAEPKDIATRAINQLRARYGVKGNINIIKLPAKAGDILEMEIEPWVS